MAGTRLTRLLTGVACALLAASAVGAAVPAGASAAPVWQIGKKLPLDTGVLPQEYSPGDTFLDVEAVGPHDAWAVGTNGYNIGAWGRPVLRHWHDGRWLSPPVPAWMDGSLPGGWVNQLQAVGGSSPDDVWALGNYYLVTESLVRAVHWNGHTWTKASVPSQGGFAPLITSVKSFGANDAWAFGCYCGASQSPYIAHFSNGHWRDVTPRALPFGGIWTASAISSSNIWAVMSDANQQSFTALHWNGSAWSTVPVPTTLPSFYPGGGIVATAQGGVWFAGSLVGTGTPAVVHDLNGTWTVTDVAAAQPLSTLISDGAGGMWSASESFGSTSAQLWHYSGGAWSQAADPAGTAGYYHITWMAHVPGGQTSLAIGDDLKNELLLSEG